MKKLILASAIFLSACSTFNGDNWAKQQLQLTVDVTKCVKLLEHDYILYASNCDGTELVERAMALSSELQDVMDTYPDNITTEEFLKAEFTDVDIGLAAIVSTNLVTTGLDYITLMLLLEDAKRHKEEVLEKNPGVHI